MTTNYNYPTYDDLKNAFDGAKNNDSAAMNQLYEWFTPLVLSVAHSYSNYTSLQEDAVNIAWECFFNFVKTYNGKDYLHVPGLIKKRLISRLADIVKSYKYYDPNALLASETTEYLEVPDTACCDAILENLYLKDAISQLSPLQQKLIYLIYFEELSYAEIAKLLNLKERRIRYQHNLARKALHKSCTELLS